MSVHRRLFDVELDGSDIGRHDGHALFVLFSSCPMQWHMSKNITISKCALKKIATSIRSSARGRSRSTDRSSCEECS